MKETKTLRFLYRTAPGRALLKMLVHPAVSKAAGIYLSSQASKWLVSYYIRKHHIDMRDIEIPREGFASFNAFFTRKKKKISRPVEKMALLSPCDGFLTVIPVEGNTVFDVKHTQFTLEDLLKDKKLAEKFYDGTALVFRLTPANYHRYGYAADGKVLRTKRIDGKLHCVRPIALRSFPVYIENSREYQVYRSEELGLVVQMEVGALLVGKIRNHADPKEKKEVRALEEKGYFEFGGSTIIVLVQKDRICMDEQLKERTNEMDEIPVCMGERVAAITE